MTIYPAVDLKGGRVVRLQQGRADAETVYNNDAAAPANAFAAAGAQWVHVVDLDGAFSGDQGNRAAVEAIVASGLKVELGGGIRSLDTIRFWLDAGVKRLVIGTKAVTDPDFLDRCIDTFGSGPLAVGIDARDGMVAIRGWVETVDVTATDFARHVVNKGIRNIIFTDISRDGMLDGPNMEALESMLTAVPQAAVIASGGVSSADDIRKLKHAALRIANLEGVITGKALYDGRLKLSEALAIAAEG
jgi:phosphoribosylformimino-5-aminoimidazole carboxamide ribotide isomerase